MPTPTLASRLFGAVAFFTLLGAAPATLAARLVDVSVVNRDTGERLTPYRHAGKLYVAGTPGQRYAVELRSRGGERLLTVVSVDGVNVLTGQTAAAAQSGYVLDDGRRVAISGWRKSLDEVAQFVFTALPDSYAARSGRPDNVGVIGVAVFREKVEVRPEPFAAEPWRGGARPPAASAPAAPLAKSESAVGSALADRRASPERHDEAVRQQLGTGHGERERAPIRYTDFVRAGDSPDEVVTIHYDSRRNLIARGIIRAPQVAEPLPFPGGTGFVPDPRS